MTRDNESEPNLCETITCNDISIFRRTNQDTKIMTTSGLATHPVLCRVHEGAERFQQVYGKGMR